MEKWADFLISAVRYNTDHTHIEYLVIQADNGDTVAIPPYIESRRQIVGNIKKKLSYLTITRTKEGKWKQGQKVIIVKINEVEYIKTVENKTEDDNLENLPEF